MLAPEVSATRPRRITSARVPLGRAWAIGARGFAEAYSVPVLLARLLVPPKQTGRYDLCLDLVQRAAPELRPLHVPPVEAAEEVVDPVGQGAGPRMQSPGDERRRATRSAFANAGRPQPCPETGVYRCR